MSATLAALALSAVISAARPRAEAAVAPSNPNAVRISGELTDEIWQTAKPIAEFVQREPHEGSEPSQKTEFRVAYNATTLFVKVRAHDNDAGKIVTYLTRRDLDSPCDWLSVMIDSYHDKRTAYEFAVNPSGVKLDRYWFNDTNRDDSWDAVWDVSVSRDPQGWTAEFRIPFSQLRFNPAESNTFGLAVQRRIGRLNETSTWPLLARSAPGYVSSFGELAGLSTAASAKKLELVPYTVASLTRQPTDGSPLLKPSTPGGAAGMDVKFALTPGLTFTGTVNPDFGQVEADPAVVNLSAFETFFAERRPFFVEGSGLFRFGLDCNDGACSSLFYSRRIGRSPQGTDNLPSGDNIYTDVPPQSTILGASKVTGRVGKYSIGVMQATTQETQARIFDGGITSRTPVEPYTNYTVSRIRREFTNQSSIGLMITSTNRQLSDSLRFLPNSAYTSGLDWDLRVNTRYSITGYIVGSRLHGTPEAIERTQEDSRHYFQRPDLRSDADDVTRTTLQGTAASLSIGKIAGERIRFNSNVQFKTPGFDVNDVGFMRRADQKTIGNWFQVRNETPNRWIKSQYLNFNEYAGWNFDGDRLFSGGNVNYSANFVNNWSAGGGIETQKRGLDDRVTRGGPAVFMEGADNFWSWFNTDNRKKISLNFFTGAGQDGLRSWFRGHEISATYRPVASLTVTSGVRVNRNRNQNQWTDNVTDSTKHYVFATLDQTTVALTERFNFTMTPTLSLELYAQPFVSSGDYGQFKELVSGRSLAYDGRYAPYAYDLEANGDPNFNVKSFRTTNVLRWEYKPGSTLFVVWQQARENDLVPGGFQFGRDVHDIFGVAPKNVFLVKLAYWLNY
jgi:hypothetical protein